MDNPVDTRRKLNVLCMFNLRPVSTGKIILYIYLVGVHIIFEAKLIDIYKISSHTFSKSKYVRGLVRNALSSHCFYRCKDSSNYFSGFDKLVSLKLSENVYENWVLFYAGSGPQFSKKWTPLQVLSTGFVIFLRRVIPENHHVKPSDIFKKQLFFRIALDDTSSATSLKSFLFLNL